MTRADSPPRFDKHSLLCIRRKQRHGCCSIVPRRGSSTRPGPRGSHGPARSVKHDQYLETELRLSIQSPTIFEIDLHPAPTGYPDRTALLHVLARRLSPRFPHPLLDRFQPYLPSVEPPDGEHDAGSSFTTTFHLVIEPLIFGVLPRTALPTLLCIIVFVFGAAVMVPAIIRWLESAVSIDREKAD